MKNLFIVFICCIAICMLAFCIQVPSGKYKNDLADENLKGPVKSYTKFFYDTYKPAENIDSDYHYMSKENFDIHGKTSSSMASNSATKPVSATHTIFYSYDNEGRKTITKDQSGEFISFSAYSSNKENNLVESYSFRPNSPVMFKIIYNKSGDRDTMYENDINGKFMAKVIYRYNKNNDLIEEECHNTNNEWSYKKIFRYDNHHHKIEEIRYDSTEKNRNKMTFAYDNLGNMIMERDTSTTDYDGGARPFSIDPTDKNYQIFKCTYSNFDSHKNWLRQDMFYKDSIAKTVKRVIEYYP